MVLIKNNTGIQWFALTIIFTYCIKLAHGFSALHNLNNDSSSTLVDKIKQQKNINAKDIEVVHNVNSFLGREWVDTNLICMKPECIHAASTMLSKMNLNVNPCVDFHEFTCGKFVQETLIAEGKTSVYTLESMKDELREKLRIILEQPIMENEIKPFVQVKELYKTCMNKTAIEERGETPLLNILKTLGGLPVLAANEWNEKSFSWTETIKKFRQLGISVNQILRFIVTVDNLDGSKRIIEIDQPDFRLSREFLVKGRNDSNVRAYYEYMRDLSIHLGADEQKAAKDMSDVVDFEIALARITAPKEERRNVSLLYNPTNIKDLQLKYPYINWIDYFNGILPSDIIIDDTEMVNVVDLRFFEKLESLLNETSKTTLANFLLCRVSSNSVKYLTNKLRKRRQEYFRIVYGQSEEHPRWRECTDLTVDTLPVATSAMYVRRYFNTDAKKTALEMVNYIKEEFETILKTVNWMDDETKREAVKKLNAMSTLVAYPDELDIDEVIINYHKPLEIENNKLLENLYKITIFTSNLSYCKLRKPVIKDDWETWALAAQVNAFYEPVYNHMKFPAGILQGQLFSATRPQYLNYGAIGIVIGHEISHGFDDLGNQFDEVGNLRDWWNPTTKQLFKEKAKCIIDQFSNTLDPQTNLYLNGVTTQGENIADMGGLKVAYLAYKRYLEKYGDEKTLPGLSYSPEQLFWISMGQIHCSKFKTEALKVHIEEDPHAPNKYRILLPSRSNVDFARDFQCPLDSPMNPAKKCEVW